MKYFKENIFLIGDLYGISQDIMNIFKFSFAFPQIKVIFYHDRKYRIRWSDQKNSKDYLIKILKGDVNSYVKRLLISVEQYVDN